MTEYANSKPGVPIIYIMSNTIVLDKPSESTTQAATEIARSLTDLTPMEQKVLKQIQDENKPERQPKKHKKPKAPNPLSCKKSKKKETSGTKVERIDTSLTSIKKRKKRRVKIASHVSDIVNQKVKILLAD